jgi:hypothetical protein
MKDSNVETMLGFNKEKRMENLAIDQKYIITPSWRWGNCFVNKNLCIFGLMMFTLG